MKIIIKRFIQVFSIFTIIIISIGCIRGAKEIILNEYNLILTNYFNAFTLICIFNLIIVSTINFISYFYYCIYNEHKKIHTYISKIYYIVLGIMSLLISSRIISKADNFILNENNNISNYIILSSIGVWLFICLLMLLICLMYINKLLADA